MADDASFEEFAIIAALVLQRVYSSFPVPVDIDLGHVAKSMGLKSAEDTLPSNRPLIPVVGHTLRWLISNDYIRSHDLVHVHHGLSITEKGLIALRAKTSEGMLFREQIEQVTTSADTNEGRRSAAEVIGSFIGSALSSFTKGVSGA